MSFDTQTNKSFSPNDVDGDCPLNIHIYRDLDSSSSLIGRRPSLKAGWAQGRGLQSVQGFEAGHVEGRDLGSCSTCPSVR